MLWMMVARMACPETLQAIRATSHENNSIVLREARRRLRDLFGVVPAPPCPLHELCLRVWRPWRLFSVDAPPDRWAQDNPIQYTLSDGSTGWGNQVWMYPEVPYSRHRTYVCVGFVDRFCQTTQHSLI